MIKRIPHSLVRFIAAFLVPVLVLSDPAWAAVAGINPVVASRASNFLSEALNSRSILPGVTTRRLFLSKTAQSLLGAVVAMSPYAAATPSSHQQKQIVVKAAQIEEQNVVLSKGEFDRAVAYPFNLTDGNQFSNLFTMILHHNPQTWAGVDEHRAAWQALFSMLHSQRKYLNFHSDQLHALGVGDRPFVRDTIVYPGLVVENPHRAWQTADIEHGAGFWGGLTAGLQSALEHVWGGVQWKSNAIVQEAWLQIHGQAITVNQTFMQGLENAEDIYLKAGSTWLDLYATDARIEHLKTIQFAATRASQRRKSFAVVNNTDSPSTLFGLEVNQENAGANIAKAVSDKQLLRTLLASALVPTPQDLNVLNTVEPRAAPLTIDRAAMEMASRVPALLQAENAPERLPASAPVPDARVYQAALASHFSTPPARFKTTADLFEPGGDAAFYDLFKNFDLPQIEETLVRSIDDAGPLSLPSLTEVFSPLPAETILAPSPKSRRLILKRDMLEQVQRKILDLQKKTRAEFGIHLDIGTIPLLAELLSFNIQRPTRTTVFGLTEMQEAVDLQMQSLNDQIQAEAIRVKTEFLAARIRRQEALKAYWTTVNQIAIQTHALNANLRMDSEYTAPDLVTPYLAIRALRAAGRQELAVALKATHEARFYTPQVQQRLEDQYVQFHLELAQKLDPDSTLTPDELNPSTPQKHPSFQFFPMLAATDAPATSGHHVLQWIWATPYHIALAAVGIMILALVIRFTMASRKGAFGRDADSLHEPIEEHRTRFLPWWLTAGAILLVVGPAVVHSAAWTTLLHAPWIQNRFLLAAASLVAMTGIPIFFPRVWQAKTLGRLFSLLAASVAVWILWPIPALAAVASFLIVAFFFHSYMTKEISEPTNLVGKASRSRRHFLALAIPAAIILGMKGLGTHGQRVMQYFEERNAMLRRSDVLAPNFGVTSRPVRFPILWTPPPGEGGVVVGTHPRATVRAGEWVVAYAPLDAGMLGRLRTINESWRAIEHSSLLSGDLIEKATTAHLNPLITLEARVAGSVDFRINTLLAQIEQRLIDFRAEQARAKAMTESVGRSSKDFIVPLPVERLRFELAEMGVQMNALLAEREARNSPAAKNFSIYDEAGLISVQTVIPDGKATQLCVQEVPEDSFLQVRMTPVDVRAFMIRLHNPQGATLRVRRHGTDDALVIPLTDIQEMVRPDDPGFKDLVVPEDFNGQPFNNPALGISKTIHVNLIVKRRRLENVPYYFEGLFDEAGKRLFEDADQVAIGEVSLLQENPSSAPHLFGLNAFRVKQTGLMTLMDHLRSQLDKIAVYRNVNPDDPWGPDFQRQTTQLLQRLASEEAMTKRAIQEILREGVTENALPKFPYRYGHYVFPRTLANDPSEEALLVIPASGVIPVGISFYANVISLPAGTIVKVAPMKGGAPVDLRITSPKSLDRANDLTHYEVEAMLPVSEARKFFLAGRPMTHGFAEIPLSTTEASRLTIAELLHALAWSAGLSAVALFYGHIEFALEALAGYVMAIGIHEFLGHGLHAYRLKLNVAPQWNWRKGIYWEEISATGERTLLVDSEVRAAGPVASEWTVRATSILLAAAFFLAWTPHWMAFLIALAISSVIFRAADYSTFEPMSPENGYSQSPAESGTLWTKHFDRSEGEQVILASLEGNGHEDVHAPLSAGELREFRDLLANTVLEQEHYYYPGDDANYVAWYQAPLLWTKQKIRLTPRMIFWRRHLRDNVHWFEAVMLGADYASEYKEPTTGTKARIYMWVVVMITFFVSYGYFLASPAVVQTILRLLSNNPLLLNLQGSPLVPLALASITTFIMGGIIFTFTKGWGEFLSTIRWNVRKLILIADRLFGDRKQRFKESTGKDALTVLRNIHKATILHPGTKEYDEFLALFARFARDMAAVAFSVFDKGTPDAPSKELLAFTTAFRIQVRRSGLSSSPIYEEDAPQLADDEELFTFLRKHYETFAPTFYAKEHTFDQLSDKDKYWLLQCARAHEVLLRMREYPVHTLMSEIRAGIAELILDLYRNTPDLRRTMHTEEQSYVEDILEWLKDRSSTLDPDVFEGMRAQTRFDQFAEILHYSIARLVDAVRHGDKGKRDRIIKVLKKSVSSPEMPTWDGFKENLNRLVDKTTKTPEKADADVNIIQSIVYVLALRRLKENLPASLNFLRSLKSSQTDPPHVTMDHRYLRDTLGQPTTSILKLNMTYQKYFDLVMELTELFPHMALLGKQNVYITLNNTFGLRQTLREVEYYLHLTRGTIYIMDDIGGTNKNFARILERNLRERLSLRDFSRVRVTNIRREASRLSKDTSAVIFSSAIPLDSKKLEKSAGTLVHVPSPLLNPVALFYLLSQKHQQIDALFNTSREPLIQECTKLQERYADVDTKRREMNNRIAALGNALTLGDTPPSWAAATAQNVQLTVQYLMAEIESRYYQQKADRLSELQQKRLRQLHALIDLQRAIHHVSVFLPTIGIDPSVFEYDQPIPTINPDNVLSGKFTLEFFIRRPRPDPSQRSWYRPKQGVLYQSA